jgi:hypothetical protein
MPKEKNIINYIIEQDISINENITAVNRDLISEIKIHYKNKSKEILNMEIICLQSKKENINDVSIITIISLIISIIAVIITLWTASDNIANNKSYEIVNNTLNQSYIIDKSINENEKKLEAFDNEYSKALDSENTQEIKRIENDSEFIEAKNNIEKYSKNRMELFERSKEQLNNISKSWNKLSAIITVLSLGIIFFIIFSRYIIIRNKYKENKNMAINIIISAIEENIKEMENKYI